MKAFEEHGVDFDFCVGTSVGSLIGALYAAGVKTRDIIPVCHELDLSDLHSRFIFKAGNPAKIGRIVTNLLGNAKIEDLEKPFYAVAVDMITAKQVIFDKGSVADAVSASCCVPLLFKPLVKDGMHLVDGGLLNNIPSETAKMLGAQTVVAVDPNPTRGGGTPNLGTLDIAKATFRIMSANSSLTGLRFSDVLISVNTGDFSSAKKDGYEQMIELGYNAALAQIDNIKEVLKNNGDKKSK
jgi:NTE family protein